MQFSRTGVSIVHGREAMATQVYHRIPAQTPADPRIDRRILDDRDRFGVSGDIGKQAESRFAQIPDAVLVARPRPQDNDSQVLPPEFVFKLRGDRSDLSRVSAASSTARMAPGSPWTKKRFLLLLEIRLRALEDIVVHQLARAGRMT